VLLLLGVAHNDIIMCTAFSNAVTTHTPTTTQGTASTSTSTAVPALADFDYNNNNRLPWLQQGYDTWEWNGRKINYLEMGGGDDVSNDNKKGPKPALLLIHGFGASAYHWRYNVPVLARDYHVYALDLLGFGLSDKPLVDYSADVWRDQAVAFVQQVIGKETVVAGNSLGGFTALYAASGTTTTVCTNQENERLDDNNHVQNLIKGCILLNGAGRFRDPEASSTDESDERSNNMIVEKIKETVQRLVIGASFLYTKQPARIEQVLRQVYPVNPNVVDAELVKSIQYPSLDDNAAEVFYRVITKNGSGPSIIYIDDLLKQLEKNGTPLLLCWGEKDPWIRSAAADKIQALYPKAQRVSIDAGHCPHDEAYDDVNAAIKDFMESL